MRRRRSCIVDRPGAAQSELRIGQVAVPRLTPDYHALLVLNAILGGQFVSRLNMNLREDKGYTYGVRSGFEFRRAPGPVHGAGGRADERDGRDACARCSRRCAPSAPTGRRRRKNSTSPSRR